MPLFQGLAAFPITPADNRGRMDTDALGTLLRRLEQAGVDSIGLLGSTGTYAYLTRAERHRTIKAAAECVGGRVPLLVGVGALRTDDAQELTRDAEGAGADGLLLAPVSYLPLNDEEVFQHFAAVAETSSLPICIYNNPSTTHFTFSDDLVARLAAVPRIVALKSPAPAPSEAEANVHALRALLPASFRIGYSGDWHSAEAVLAGGVAWYSVIGGLLPRPALALMRAAQKGDKAEVDRLNTSLNPFWDLFKRYGSLRVVYAAANLLRLIEAQPPRPILPLSIAEHALVENALAMLDT